tara:strand:+ start:779 stop:1249 length:471 start_codon:yes stop_codon:yes gene_type:complete
MIEADVLVESKNWKKILQNPRKQVANILKRFPSHYRFNYRKVYISVLLTNNNKIKSLNKKFRKKNKPTDILSFPSYSKKNLAKNLKNKKFYLGDIAISHQEFSKNNKNNYKNGFIKIFIHGFLHLLNFDHKSDKDFKRMNSIENKIFQNVKGKFEI